MKETGVIFCLIRDNKILLQERDENCKKFPLSWCLPGGAKEEYDKTYEDTLLREIKEEYDLDLKLEQCTFVTNYNNGADRVYVCRVGEEQVPKLNEGMSMKWMTIAEVEKLDLGFNQNGLIPFLKKTVM